MPDRDPDLVLAGEVRALIRLVEATLPQEAAERLAAARASADTGEAVSGPLTLAGRPATALPDALLTWPLRYYGDALGDGSVACGACRDSLDRDENDGRNSSLAELAEALALHIGRCSHPELPDPTRARAAAARLTAADQ